MTHDVVVPEPSLEQVLAEPVVEASANAQTLVIGENDEPMTHLDRVGLGMRKVKVGSERHQVLPDERPEALGRLVDVGTQIVMTPEQLPCGVMDLVDSDFHWRVGLNRPPGEGGGGHIVDPVRLKPVDDVVVTSHRDELPLLTAN